MKIFVRSAFNYDTAEASDASGLSCADDPGYTQQQFAEECDINTLIRRFGLTGELPVNQRVPLPDDQVYEKLDLASCMNYVRNSEQAFMAQPASVRDRFQNDPVKFVEFFQDPANAPEAIRLGLLPKPPEPVSPPA